MIDSSLINYIKKHSNSRTMDTIVIHCSATKEKKDYSIEDIKKWHLQRGFKDVGYHFVIKLDGTIEIGRPLDKIGAHVANHNNNTIGVCYIGGVSQEGENTDTRTAAQKVALRKLLKDLSFKYHASIHGHNEYSNKDCPCFNAREEYKDIEWHK